MIERRTVDVVIAGAGPAGLVAAIAFAKHGFSVFIADTAPAASSKAASGRSAALLNSTVGFLRELGLWSACEPYTAPLAALQFIDDTGRIVRAPDIVFRASEIGEPAFGYNIPNADLVQVLTAHLADLGVTLTTHGPVANIEFAPASVDLRFESGIEVTASLAVAADGRTSPLREAAGIHTMSWQYDQTAIATSFAHDRPHNGLCIEMHRAAGPFTLVPLPGQRSSLVWVERKDEAARLAALTDDDFSREVERVSRYSLGTISNLASRAAFPLSSLAARDYGARRIAVVGEAAHVTPPIGAQGLNLGFRDVERIVAIVRNARDKREDIGSDTLLRSYSASRRGDVLTRTAGVDLLNRSLLSDFMPLAAARSASLMVLGAIGPLRRTFMRRGISPDA